MLERATHLVKKFQGHLRNTADAVTDLAESFGVPPKVTEIFQPKSHGRVGDVFGPTRPASTIDVNAEKMIPTDYSLADFFYADEGDDALTPPPEYAAWRQAAKWEMGLYEPHLYGPPGPRVEMMRGGKRRKVINLSSYNYMGLATHPQVIRAAKKALNRYGTGACGSPVLSGLADLHRELEEKLVAFTGRENVMLFNSGFGGALGTVAGLMRKGDAAILDSKCHLSLIDGAKLSGARLHFFDHNDAKSLEEVLEKTTGKRRLIIVEGIYSMDGDMANLPEIVPVAQHHNCSIFIDEAHSILAWGAHGRGVVEHFGFEKEVGLQFGTFSKSFASVGGFVAGRYNTIDYLRFYSNPYGFSCALPPSVVGGLLKALELTTETNALREVLWDNTRYFREGLLEMGVNIGESTSQVVPIIIGANRNLLYQLCHEMNDRGLFLAPVDYPSVPEDGLRYRAAVTAAHTKEDLAQALQIIKDTVVRRTQ